jgi:hypothetical protein
MNIPFRQRQLIVEVEKVAPSISHESALEGASDREVERFARNAHTPREPRWDTQALIYGFRL